MRVVLAVLFLSAAVSRLGYASAAGRDALCYDSERPRRSLERLSARSHGFLRVRSLKARRRCGGTAPDYGA